jgi:radical SAM protein with 4Fe4S-binding SPASM domain
LGYISFSVDGYDKATYEQIRVNADYEETIANIVGFLRIKQVLKAKHPYVRIQSIVNQQSDERFSTDKQRAFAKLFRGLPVDDFDTVAVTNMAQELPTNVYAIEKPKTVAEYERLGFTYHPCHRLWSTLTILWDGTVVPCCFDFHGKLPVGNVRERSLLEIWNGKPMQDLRTLHTQKTIDHVPLCSTCNIPFSPTVGGLPIHFAGHQSLLRKYLGPRLYGKIGTRIRFRGLNLVD